MSLLAGDPCFEEAFTNLARAAKPSTSDSMLFGPVLCGPAAWSLWGSEYIGFPESNLMQCADENKTQVGEQSHLQEGT